MPTNTATLGESVRWSLSTLYDGIKDARIPTDLKNVETEAQAFATKYKGKLSSLSAEELAAAIAKKTEISSQYYRLSQFIHLLFSTDVSDNEVKALMSQIEQVGTDISNQLLFFRLELSEVDDAKYQEWRNSDSLNNFHYSLERIKDSAKYQLSEKEEQMIQVKDLTGADANRKLYGELTASFEFDFEVDGDRKTLNGSELRALRQHPDPDVRKRAMEVFFGRYESEQLVLTHLFNNIIRDYNIERKQRGYSSPIQRKNHGNDLPDDVIDTLHEVCTESNTLVQRYYRLKAKLLGLPNFTLSDIYAPLPDTESKYSYEEAKSLVLDSFQGFDPEFYELAKSIFDENHVDVPVSAKKRGGAYCSSSVPGITPFVFLNFLGRARDVSTIAHELGHAVHACLSSDQPLWSYHAILPLCETASVFSEMILMDHMKKQDLSPKLRLAMLSEKLEDIFATSHRQNMFSRFEMAMHGRLSEGILSADELCDLYKKELEIMFGDSVEIPEHYQWEWSSIPHMLDVPFYVYSYNFGNLLTMALYQEYCEQGEAFIPKLKTFLSAGSSDAPVALTEALGVDIHDRKFWEKSMLAIEAMLDEWESLLPN